MRRTLSVIAILLVMAGGGWGVPLPKDRLNKAYFPIRVGDRWVLQIKNGDSVSEVTEVVTEVEKTDGQFIVTVGREINGQVSRFSKTLVTEKGIFRLSQGKVTYDPPLCVLMVGAKRGETWQNDTRGKTRQIKYTAEGEEEIEVPAGKFKALRVTTELILDEARGTKATVWYAPSLGLIKSVSEIKEVQRVQLLKSFTPAK